MSDINIRFCVIDADHIVDENNAYVRLWGIDKNGRKVLCVDRYDPYFYVQLKDELDSNVGIKLFREQLARLKEFGGGIKNIELVKKKLLGVEKNFIKIIVRQPSDVQRLRDIIKNWEIVNEEYEYDIPLYRRYLIDKGIVPMGWVEVRGKAKPCTEHCDIKVEARDVIIFKDAPAQPHILAFDIEMCGNDIIMISMVDNKNFKKALAWGWQKGNKRVEILSNEKELLERFISLIKERNPDIIVTYNGDRFDFAKIRERCDVYKLALNLGRDDSVVVFTKRGRIRSAKIKGIAHVDIYDFIEQILGPSLSSEILTLDMVANELLGVGKKQLEWQDIESLWRKREGLDKIADYCLFDSELTLRLADYILPQIYELCRIVGQPLFDISRMPYSQLVEWLLIRNAYRKGEMVLNRPKFDEIRRRREAEPYTGGYVYSPKEGIHEDIALFDFQSLYPSIIITYNISPETLDKKNGEEHKVPGNDHFFTTKFKGFIPSIVEELIRKRIAIKRKMKKVKKNSIEHRMLYNRQYALKILANSSYGYYAFPGARWYSRVCAKSIAAWGRKYIQDVIDFATRNGYEVVYGDTDSLFIKDCDKKRAKNFLEAVNKMLPETMELDLQGIYKSGIFVLTKTGTVAKKRYALLDYDGKIVIRGFEKVRRDWANIAKETQEKVLLAVLKDRNEKKALDIVRATIERIRSGKVDMKDLVIYTQITKPLNEYDQNAPHVAAAKKYVGRGKVITEGSVIGYIITKGDGSISDRAVPYEYAKDYDPEYYINNQVVPAALRVLQGLGYKEEDIFSATEKTQSSLESFFRKSFKNRIFRR
ncbi:MAG TPA: hypothetical protein ENG42_00955 [Candidatus Aenigmarchaeota archaeon]|nr:hypothetical protein [Candidatus Aenigmarchaeota archaeon]